MPYDTLLTLKFLKVPQFQIIEKFKKLTGTTSNPQRKVSKNRNSNKKEKKEIFSLNF
jgi:hypothetical protein